MSRKILLIEDNDQNAYLVRVLLEPHGYEMIIAADGAAGIDCARSFVPALILLDIQLPTMDGYTVARKLREIEGLRTTPIIAVTSYAMAGDREKALEAGCTGYIEKPIDPETFASEVARLAGLPTVQEENS